MEIKIKQRIAQIQRGEVPEGYKKFSVGVRPSEWNCKRLKEICIINPPRTKTESEKTTFLGMSDVDESGHILCQNLIDTNQVKEGLTPFEKGDILVAKITPCFENGKGANTKELCTQTGVGSTEFHVLRSKINADFIFYHTLSRTFRRKLEIEMTGSAGQKRVQTDSLANYEIAVPYIQEQQNIAAVLMTQDKIIELKEKLLSEKQQQKKYLMQQLLTGKKRLPGFSGEWRKVRLHQIVGRLTKRNTIGNRNVLTISAQFGLINQGEFFNKTIASDDKSNYFLLEKGDFAYNKSYSNGYPFGAIKRLSLYDAGIVSPLYICFRMLDDRNSASYFEHYFEAGLMNQEIQAFAQEGARNHGLLNISVEDFFNSKILIPALEEQTAIAEILSTADHEIDLLQKEIEQEKQKKKALMQLLLTGIVRVKA